MSLADLTRKHMRDFVHIKRERDARQGGGKFTRPSLAQRRARRRKKNAVSKLARRANRR